MGHDHDTNERRDLTLADGTARTVETCTCGAIRTIDLIVADLTPTRLREGTLNIESGWISLGPPVIVSGPTKATVTSEWRHREADIAG